MERYIQKFLKVNQDIASAKVRIVNQNEILINEIRRNQRERARRNRQQNYRRHTARATYFRNQRNENEDEVRIAEQRIREVFNVRDMNNEMIIADEQD